MRFPSILAIFIVFLVWLSYQLRKNPRSSSDTFWDRELKADSVRRQPLDSLHYITIPTDSLPFFYGIDQKLDELQNIIQGLSEKPIVNLTGYSNTDLKLAYGVANLPLLTEYDQNFILLARTLFQWGSKLDELNYKKEAIRVLEFGISCQTDVSGHYLLLARLYREQQTPEKIEALTDSASALDTLMKDSIIRQLKEI